MLLGMWADRKLQTMFDAVTAYTPNEDVDAALKQLVIEARNDGAPQARIASMLAGCLQDGINHGNWPRVQVKT